MFVFKKYDRQNHVGSFMTKYLRFLCKFTSWSCGCIEYTLPCAEFEHRLLVVMGTDCIGSCKFHYHTIITTTASNWALMFLQIFSKGALIYHSMNSEGNTNEDPPRYNWNIIESGVKHHTQTNKQINLLMFINIHVLSY
jgi:hypothetical protein